MLRVGCKGESVEWAVVMCIADSVEFGVQGVKCRA